MSSIFVHLSVVGERLKLITVVQQLNVQLKRVLASGVSTRYDRERVILTINVRRPRVGLYLAKSAFSPLGLTAQCV
jgi:hypothetical protein